MEKVNARQSAILKLVEARGFVSTEELGSHFGVTPQTIRRDINNLCDRNLLHRFHGGAGIRRPENDPYQTRQQSQHHSKQQIGAMLAKKVEDGASLFINIGTTTESVARALLHKKHLRIATNNLHVADILAENPTFEISVAGGILRKRDRGIVGYMATEFISQFRMDYGIIGVSGISPDGSLLDFDQRETQTAKQIIKNSAKVLLVADHSKFGRRAVVRYGCLNDVDSLFTDRPPPPEYYDAIRAANVELHFDIETLEHGTGGI